MRYFIGFLVTIGLVILLIVLLFGGGGSDKAKVPKTAKALSSYADSDAEVRMTIDGPINANQEHQQIRITADKDQVTYQHIRGYDGSVVDSHAYHNTVNAYASFLHALEHAGFTQTDDSKELKDERGYCPLGNRYIFEFIKGGGTIERHWATNCGKPRTYLGNTVLTIRLFTAQVPGYNDLTNNIENFTSL